jgi:hypothetical protein
MGLISLLNRPTVNQQAGAIEFRGSTFDGEAKVNHLGIHNHGNGFKENALETAADAVGTFGGPLGTVAHGANAIRKAFKGEWGGALKSVGKGLVSLIPGVGTLVNGASMVKNAGDTMMHGAGWAEQKMKGGYENQTRMATQLMGGNMMFGMGGAYGGNYMPYSMAGAYPGVGGYGGPGYW